jgi:hypothetical protein
MVENAIVSAFVLVAVAFCVMAAIVTVNRHGR